jgi:hypothetical protein
MNITDILDKLGVEHRAAGEDKHSRDGWVQLPCPMCGRGGGQFHMGYNLAKGYFHCWKCRGHHPVAVFVALGMPRREAQTVWKGLDRERSPFEPAPVMGRFKAPYGVGKMQQCHKDYLLSRGFRPDTLQRVWKLGGIGLHPRLSWRLYAPVMLQGAPVSWTTRSIAPNAPQRYLSASSDEEAVNHKECLYGADLAGSVVVAVEGPADAWAIGPGAVALFGTAYTVAQVRRLANFPIRYVCFDNSHDAQREARKLVAALSVFPGTTANLELDAKDPGEASKKELALLRRTCGL